MASDSPVILRTHIPQYTPGGPLTNETSENATDPVHIVLHPSQLPSEFLHPSSEKQLVIGFDCEGIDLCEKGALCVMQLAFQDAIYLVDAIEGGEALVQACKNALESNYITKVIHDCKRDSEALYHQYDIKLHNVIDTQVCHMLKKKKYDAFLERPMSEKMIRTAADDVRFLLYIYQKMLEKLDSRSLWQLLFRGCLYCRCFCTSDKNYSDWPPLPVLPDTLVSEGDASQEEILSVLEVPPGKMGLVIGKKGASILEIKKGCNAADIILGGAKGPPNKVFIIGPVMEVRKAEAIIRGRFVEF
ncbi:hypothetical protein HPP92_008948 [Vanilla planifolia]|uniref:3'-5' exonuclease domain-containing protein n=1 Tax=Vanilla planifolia TaxID=51239 RepID=A0A835RAK7_VANPL|nr:hypothetical protein HPP92_008948 [Vanilla planifolia]